MELRAKLGFQKIASRLAEREPRPKIARDLNLRPDQLKRIIRSGEFLAYLDEQESPALTDIALSIREELEARKESDAAKMILEAEAEATEELLDQMREADKTSDRRAAAVAVIELARKLQAERKDTKTQKMDIPASQQKVLLEAAREMDERYTKPIHPDDVAGPAIQPAVSTP